MTGRSCIPLTVLVVIVLALGASIPADGQTAKDSTQTWTPARLADGQPNIQGMWNSVGATHTPLQLPAALAGRANLSPVELQALVQARAQRRAGAPEWTSPASSENVNEGDLAYASYWFDTYWSEPVAGDAPALVVEPANGRIPDWTPQTREMLRHTRERLHDSYEYMESGDRCITRGVLGMMMPTAYNNGTLILQPPGYVVLHSEMIHNARIIPIDDRPHLDERIRQWDGDPRGHWEGNTLVVESTNFKTVRSMRGASALIRSRQTEQQRLVERFTFVDPSSLKYSLRVDDPDTYAAPWTVAFQLRRDDGYHQFEYACHEGNYSVPNALSGARAQERQ